MLICNRNITCSFLVPPHRPCHLPISPTLTSLISPLSLCLSVPNCFPCTPSPSFTPGLPLPPHTIQTGSRTSRAKSALCQPSLSLHPRPPCPSLVSHSNLRSPVTHQERGTAQPPSPEKQDEPVSPSPLQEPGGAPPPYPPLTGSFSVTPQNPHSLLCPAGIKGPQEDRPGSHPLPSPGSCARKSC